ncbi:MAG: CRISPR-associated endonuclease Cas1, partial [Chloroflexota bacterium]|nr:CRISPR-associated endonuclease Cas1 [Chloroflexota bacterium]
DLLATPEGDRVRQRIVDSNRHRPQRRRFSSPKSHPQAAMLERVHADDADQDDAVWAERGDYWQDHASITQPRTRHRDKRSVHEPLILTGHGVQGRIEQGTLVIRNGFTHYPQRRQEWRFFPGDRALPTRIIVLDADGSISLHVVSWLARHGIPLVLLDWQGQVTSVLNGDGTAPDATLRQAQRDAQHDGRELHLATHLIRAKLDASLDTLRSLPASPTREQSIARVQRARHELDVLPPPTIEALRLAEGRAALAYFICWETIPLRWKGTGRRPIPEDWHHARLRQSFVSGTNRHATHPLNAMLNYAYGVLESQVRIATVATGLDPTMGYLHACRPGRVALVYDLMEPLRPQVDRLVLDFVQERTFDPRDFTLTERGVCRLHPQLAQVVAGLAASNRRVQEAVAATMLELTRLV